jgi:hypothetical protein
MGGAELAEHAVDETSTILSIPCGRNEGAIPLPRLRPIDAVESPVVEPVADRLPDLLKDLQLRELGRLRRPLGRGPRFGLPRLRPALESAGRRAGIDQNRAKQDSP